MAKPSSRSKLSQPAPTMEQEQMPAQIDSNVSVTAEEVEAQIPVVSSVVKDKEETDKIITAERRRRHLLGYL